MLEQRLLHGFSKWGPRARARQGAGGNAPGPHFWRKEEIASDHQMWQVVVGGRHFSTRPGRHFPMPGPWLRAYASREHIFWQTFCNFLINVFQVVRHLTTPAATTPYKRCSASISSSSWRRFCLQSVIARPPFLTTQRPVHVQKRASSFQTTTLLIPDDDHSLPGFEGYFQTWRNTELLLLLRDRFYDRPQMQEIATVMLNGYSVRCWHQIWIRVRYFRNKMDNKEFL